MRRLRFTLPAIALALGVAATPTAVASARPCAGAHTAPTRTTTASARRATLCLLNRQRTRHGLARLRQQPLLARAARTYAREMVDQGFFAHVSPLGSTMAQRIRRTRYLHDMHDWSIGENLAWGAGSAATPLRIVVAWMHSPDHRRNILDPAFREIGIGIAPGAPAGAGPVAPAGTYATEFGVRAP